jgi:hypothetical protein
MRNQLCAFMSTALVLLPLIALADAQAHPGVTPRTIPLALVAPTNLRRTTDTTICAAHLGPIENASSCQSRLKLAQIILVWDYSGPLSAGAAVGFQINRGGTDALDIFNGSKGWYLGLGQGYGNAGPGDCFSVFARTRDGLSKSSTSNTACLPNPAPTNVRRTTDPAVCAAHLAPIESSSSCTSRMHAGQIIIVWDYAYTLDANGTLGFTVYHTGGTKSLDVFNGAKGWYMGSGTGYGNVAAGNCLYVIARWRIATSALSGHSNTYCLPKARHM